MGIVANTTDATSKRWHATLKRDQDDKAELQRVREIVAELRRDGMSPHDVAAALRAARLMRAKTKQKPGYVNLFYANPAIIGHVLILPCEPELRPDAIGLGDVATLTFDVERGDGDG